MKYCTYCGNEIADEAVICVHCGRMVAQPASPAPAQKSGSGLNMMCLLGFIFSFIVSVVGLILSIVGYNQVKNSNESTNKNLAKAGIIISSISLGLALFVVFFWFYIYAIIIGGLIWM